MIKNIMSSCQPATAFNACPAWHTVTNLYTCQPQTFPGQPATTACQTNTASCMNPNEGAIDARWAATPPVRPGKMSRARPYPCADLSPYAFNPQDNQCEPVPVGTPGALPGPTPCVVGNSPFVYLGPTY